MCLNQKVASTEYRYSKPDISNITIFQQSVTLKILGLHSVTNRCIAKKNPNSQYMHAVYTKVTTYILLELLE